jgi:MFS family permease
MCGAEGVVRRGRAPLNGWVSRFLRTAGTQTFSSLAVRNYRLFFVGQLVSVTGTWMQTVAQSFLVLQLTHSGSALGLTTAARFAPMFLWGPWGGLIADRLDKRRLLYATQALSALLALAFGVLVGTHLIRLWSVYLLATLLGLVNVFDNPARQAMISELVPREQLSNAVTLNSVTVNMARIFGAAVGGVVAAAVGLAVAFDLNAVSFLGVLIVLAMMSPADMAVPAPQVRERGQIRAGLRYAAATPGLLVPLIMIAVVGTLAWEFQVSLPLLAQRTFHGDAGTYGAMTAAMGVGAVIGGLFTASRQNPRARGLAVAAVGWGLAITAAALAPTLPLEYVVLLFVGYGSISFNSLAKTTLQLTAAPVMRGRVMALWALAWQGSTPIGGPIIGWMSDEFGPRWSLLAGGVPTIAVGLAALPVLARLGRGADTAAGRWRHRPGALAGGKGPAERAAGHPEQASRVHNEN